MRFNGPFLVKNNSNKFLCVDISFWQFEIQTQNRPFFEHFALL